jgi:hypothetical protein
MKSKILVEISDAENQKAAKGLPLSEYSFLQVELYQK